MTTFVAGSVEYLTVSVTADVELDAQTVALSIDEGTTWEAAAWQGTAGLTREARTSSPVTIPSTAGPRRVLVKITATPEVPIVYAGRITVI